MKLFNLKLLPFFIFYICNAKIVHEASTYELSELINDTKYILIENIQDGKRSEKYYINNLEVQNHEFISSKALSNLKELEIEAKKAQDERERKFKFTNDAQIKTLKKLIFLKLQEIKECISKLKKLNRTDYFVYSRETFLGEDDFNSFKESLEDIDRMIDSDKDLIVKDFQLLLDKLENRATKVQIFVRQTLENAINKCDDTKLLKELLDII